MSVQTMLESVGLSPEQAARRILELESAYVPSAVQPAQLVAAADQRLPGVVIAPSGSPSSFKAAPLTAGRVKMRDTAPRRDAQKVKAQRKAARAARKRQRR